MLVSLAFQGMLAAGVPPRGMLSDVPPSLPVRLLAQATPPSLPLPPAAVPPGPSAAWGRLVVLAPRCGRRPASWGEALDVGLADALRGAEGEDALRDLTEVELAALHEWQKNAAAACATLDAAALPRADALIGR